MKKSEVIMDEIARLNAEYDERIKRDVFASFSDDTPEQHDKKWELFWTSYGRKTNDRIRELEFEYHKEVNREVAVGDGVTLRLWSDREAYTVI